MPKSATRSALRGQILSLASAGVLAASSLLAFGVEAARAEGVTQATDATSAQPLAVMTGNVGSEVARSAVASTSTVLLEVEYPGDVDKKGVPTTLTDVVVNSASVDTGGNFAVPLPDNATVRGAAQNGWVSTLTVVHSGGASTASYTPVLIDPSQSAAPIEDQVVAGTSIAEAPMSATAVDPVVAKAVKANQSSFDKAAKERSQNADAVVVPMDNTVCQWSKVSSSETTARVGELHVADTSGSSGTFQYHTQADSTFTVGMSLNGGGYGDTGSVTVSNSIGATGSYTRGADHRSYANDHMYWGKYQNNGAASCPGLRYKVQATSSAGDVFEGPNDPGVAPWSSCHVDPNGYATVAVSGTFDQDRATAHDYGFVASAFGYEAGGHTGYTSGIHVALHNNGSVRTYACGDRQMPNPSIIYNKKY